MAKSGRISEEGEASASLMKFGSERSASSPFRHNRIVCGTEEGACPKLHAEFKLSHAA